MKIKTKENTKLLARWSILLLFWIMIGTFAHSSEINETA